MKNELIIEIRQGIGGDESISFLHDLKNMYLKFFQKKNINYKILINNDKEIILELEDSKYNKFIINESGIHKVQRVPKNENLGKIHTSTCSVFITNNSNKDFFIENKDLKIETCRSSGAGGQHVNTTNSSIKVKHIPTNLSVECSDERSQLLNKNKAIKILNIKIKKKINDKINNDINNLRKNIISKSERCKKIRTYNFPNNKIINHINNVTYFQLNKILKGYLDIIFEN